MDKNDTLSINSITFGKYKGDILKNMLKDRKYCKWLKEQDMCMVTLWNDTPIQVTPPTFVILAITDTDPGLKGDTSGGGGKPATLESGAIVRVPLFVQKGELIKVDTRNGEYVSRAKE